MPQPRAVQLHSQSSGIGPPLLILHGLFGSGANWKRTAQDLAREYRVLLPDLRNHGRSPHAVEMDYPVMAEDIAALLVREELEQSAIIGHSMGGKVAMTLALTRPERVAALVVVDVAPIVYGPHLQSYLEAMRGLDLKRIDSRSEADRALAASLSETPVRQFLLTNLEHRGGGYRWRIPLDILAERMPLLEGFPELATSYSGPTLFIHGERSSYVSQNSDRSIRQLFPQAEFACIANAGHWLHIEAPEAFSEVLGRFLAHAYPGL